MVARINSGKSISKALNYNEKKVQQGEAEFLAAQNFLKDANALNFYQKLAMFEKLNSLNEKVVTNTLHVSLNFDPSEKLENEKLIEIATMYMKGIGFGDQPYLIYRHFDTNHPHIHIVSTNIRWDGSRISLHNLGRNQSETTRKAIEKEFGLVKAESKKQVEAAQLKPVSAQRINPGKRATKAAIQNILRVVIYDYKFTSLAELNAVLRLYNVTADRCGENSTTFRHNGLLYRVLNAQGEKIGTPIKASLFYMKPTLKNLEGRFTENEKLRQPHARRIRTTIDYLFLKYKPANIDSLKKLLEKEQISLVIRQNKENIIYGLTYVDHKTKCVFNGSDLGKSYSAKLILERCSSPGMEATRSLADEKKVILRSEKTLASQQNQHTSLSFPNLSNDSNTTPPLDYVPYQLKRYKRKRKKKRLKL
ncbi:MAG: relaxase/mobilization nuclease domain-containing protein [Chitinophagaceae bacterium]